MVDKCCERNSITLALSVNNAGATDSARPEIATATAPQPDDAGA